MSKVKILGLGHPRTGTGYTAAALNKWGLEIGHEEPKPDGIVSWTLIQEDQPQVSESKYKERFDKMGQAYNWKRPTYDTLIYNVRNPIESLPSLVYVVISPTIKRYIKELVGVNFDSTNPIEDWIESIVNFDKIITSLNPDIIYRVEDQDDFLYYALSKRVTISRDYRPHRKKENNKSHAPFKSLIKDFGPPKEFYVDLIKKYCDDYNYPRVNFS